MAFKLENNVPEYYPERSRDFQLLCRVLNVFLAASMEQAAHVVDSWEVEQADEKLLPLIARKLGCVEGSYFPPKILRNLCRSYPNILRWKGTERALKELAYAVLSANQAVSRLTIDRDQYSDIICWHIISDAQSVGDEIYISKLLPYILPAGVEVRTTLGVTRSYRSTTQIAPMSSVYRIRHNLAATSQVAVRGADLPKLHSGSWSRALEKYSVEEDSDKICVVYSKVGVGTVVGGEIDESKKVVEDPSINVSNPPSPTVVSGEQVKE